MNHLFNNFGNTLLPQVGEFKHLWVLLMSEGRLTDWGCGCSDVEAVPHRRGNERKKQAVSLLVHLPWMDGRKILL